MTTEVNPGVEVNDSEKPENKNEPSGNSNEEDQQADGNIEVATNGSENKNPGESDQSNATVEQSPPSSPKEKSPGKLKQEKEAHEGKGISRFLPPWLKKQKSLSQADSNEDNKDNVAESSDAMQVKDEQVNSHDEKTEDQAVEDETESKEEKPPVCNAEPSKEEKQLETEKVEEVVKKDGEKELKEKSSVENKKESSFKPPRKMKSVPCRVTLLDKTEYTCDIEKRAKGQVLFSKVCESLNLLETDYFGLTYRDNADHKSWLDPAKEIKRQIRSSPWQFVFNVKFYPPDPSLLTEDITRYHLCLQLRQDIASGRLPCSFVTHALLGSLTLQAEVGDYDAEEHGADYISDFQFAPNQTKELEDKVVELHKTHRGLTPAQADINFLENAKKLSMYGVDLHHAKDSEGVDIMLGVCSNGLLIYKDRLRINRFAWPKILKISYKRSNFFIKVRPGELEHFESTIGFKLPNHRAAKRLWKVCVEHHTFYRLSSPEQPPKAKFLTLGSKFRYSGRTQAQTRDASMKIDRPAPYFERTSSKRVSRSLDGAPLGSITDQSLLKEVPDAKVSAIDGVVSGLGDVTCEPWNGKPGIDTGFALNNDTKSKSLRLQGENIYVRHSNLMLEDLDKSPEEILKHQASISELKRSFMESTTEPRPNEWEKRCITPISLQTQGSLEEEMTSILFSKESFSTFTSSNQRTTEANVVNDSLPSDMLSVSYSPPLSEKLLLPRTRGMRTGLSDALENSNEVENVEEEKKQSDSDTKNTAVTEDLKLEINGDVEHPKDTSEQTEEVKELDKNEKQSVSSYDSSSESENEVEYKAEQRLPEHVLQEEPEESAEEIKEDEPIDESQGFVSEDHTVRITVTQIQEKTEVISQEITVTTYESGEEIVEDDHEVHEEENNKMNGDISHSDDTSAQIICCSEPPVVKTEMVTISDATQRTEISTKEVPIVQTETKTITFESAQAVGSGDGEPGILLSAQTITSDSVLTTTTTHITKTGKGGISETRIEKRIVISGDADIDHDEALAQAIKEAKEQHPDMSITRVVVHKETEVTEEEDENEQ
ncbi:PREDICTED: protein 4.1-like isoform X6 [Nanorana parkeri]|uniref:protein 4.1-like isoform X6 n=1 Tax=Nanorana parkeri TaxID=125878 RepID=UPI0008544CA3|nr:PREDICTED: protein 4.1-like isoform X6 [Nanorana parkeri]